MVWVVQMSILSLSNTALVVLAMLIGGCATHSSTSTLPQSKKVQDILDLSTQAITAYQQGNAQKWQSLLCNNHPDRPLSGWKDMRALVGDIEHIRLVLVQDRTKAGNASPEQKFESVEYEVQSENYPLKFLLLTFLGGDKPGCVELIY